MDIHKRRVLNLIAPKTSVAFCITKTSHLVIQSQLCGRDTCRNDLIPVQRVNLATTCRGNQSQGCRVPVE